MPSKTHHHPSGINSDSLDTGLGHMGSDPGSILDNFEQKSNGGQNGSVLRQSNSNMSGESSGKDKKANKNQQKLAKEMSGDKPKASWSEHVWSKSHFECFF